MGQPKRFTPDQVEAIRNSTKTTVALAAEYKTSRVTISKIKNFHGAYQNQVLALGTPILNVHGQTVGVEPNDH